MKIPFEIIFQYIRDLCVVDHVRDYFDSETSEVYAAAICLTLKSSCSLIDKIHSVISARFNNSHLNEESTKGLVLGSWMDLNS